MCQDFVTRRNIGASRRARMPRQASRASIRPASWGPCARTSRRTRHRSMRIAKLRQAIRKRKTAETEGPIMPPTPASRPALPNRTAPTASSSVATTTTVEWPRGKSKGPRSSVCQPLASTCARRCRSQRCGRHRPHGEGRTPRRAAQSPSSLACRQTKRTPMPGRDIGKDDPAEQQHRGRIDDARIPFRQSTPSRAHPGMISAVNHHIGKTSAVQPRDGDVRLAK